MQHEFQRVAIVNRGEAAMRFIHAAREFNQEHGVPLRTIALFTEPDRHAMFVREADEAVSLGAAQFIDPGYPPAQEQLPRLRRGWNMRWQPRVPTQFGWDGASWRNTRHSPIYAGRWALYSSGPDGDVMRRLGDKIAAKRLAEQSQIPVAPWSGGAGGDSRGRLRHAERLGFPLLIKATAGGGGRGIRRRAFGEPIPQAFESARAEAFKAFGDPTVFLEQLVQGARHVEVQIIADQYGTTWAAGVRDCTIQRRHQKDSEEAPSPALSRQEDEAIREAAVRLSQAAGYCNAGTVEFLYEPESQRFWFMEVNTRLQVEHPVTECTTGLDLVKLQIHVARGGRLEGEPRAATVTRSKRA